MTTTVSVFVPCYGYAHVLRQCVESILNQPGVDVSVLIIDDASPDDTRAVADELVAQDSRVAYRRHIVNQGHIATYNEGLEWAVGDYTMLLSADDMLVEGALQRVTSALDVTPHASFGYGRALVWRQGDALPSPSTVDGECPFQVVRGQLWIEDVCRAGDNPVYSPEVITRTSIQKEVGGYRARFPHTGDMEMWLRLAAHGDVVVLDADQAYYRIHGQNMHGSYQKSIEDLEQRRDAFFSVFDEHADRIADGARLRRIARRSMVREEIRCATHSIDVGEGRSEAIIRLRRALRFDPVYTVSNRVFYTCLMRFVVGQRVYAHVRNAGIRLSEIASSGGAADAVR